MAKIGESHVIYGPSEEESERSVTDSDPYLESPLSPTGSSAGTDGSSSVPTDAFPALNPDDVASIGQAINEFGHRLLRNLPQHKNLFFSPPQLHWLLSSLYLGSHGNTKAQLELVLGYTDITTPHNQLQNFFKDFIRTLRLKGKEGNIKFESAFYVPERNVFFEPFCKMLSEHFFASVRTLTPGDNPERTRGEINRWIEAATQGLVESVISEYARQTPPRGLVVSAAYVEHVWGSRFDHHKTIVADFNNNGSEPCKTRMLRSVDTYRYSVSKTLAARCLVIPSNIRDWEMVLFLPIDRRGVHVVEYRLDPSVFQATLGSCHETRVELSMPIFEMESSVPLRNVLESLGLTELFDERKATLTAMFKFPGTSITEMVHKTKVKVDKMGMEGEYQGPLFVSQNAVCTHRVVQFHVNHPFLFVLYDTQKNTMLFIGRVVELLW